MTSPELRAAIRNTFVAVREYARAKLPTATHDINNYTYSYKLPKEDQPSIVSTMVTCIVSPPSVCSHCTS